MKKNTKLCAKNALDDDFMKKQCEDNTAYRFMRSVRSSPAFLSTKKNHL